MNLTDFDFTLPDQLIAKKPIEPRDHARLLVFDNKIQDRYFFELENFLKPGDVLVLNDSKVIPANITMFNNNGAKINVNLIKHLDQTSWQAFIKPAKKVKIGEVLCDANHKIILEIVKKLEDGSAILDTKLLLSEFLKLLEEYGKMPIPPYLKREADSQDNEDYQTVYAKDSGSVAAPTAGLHFTKEQLIKLQEKGIKLAYVTLHVGAGTFLPVKVENISEHKMHSEFYIVDKVNADIINNAKKNNCQIIAVGTTSLRSLESCCDKNGLIKAQAAETNIFIKPGYKIKSIDKLITNFHLPKSTLLMLVSALVGFEEMHKIYQHAIAKEYRFFSYGDACLLTKGYK
jgi:S-adenosylmethionine:tRNA ribosyltransferase-isomerase